MVQSPYGDCFYFYEFELNGESFSGCVFQSPYGDCFYFYPVNQVMEREQIRVSVPLRGLFLFLLINLRVLQRTHPRFQSPYGDCFYFYKSYDWTSCRR